MRKYDMRKGPSGEALSSRASALTTAAAARPPEIQMATPGQQRLDRSHALIVRRSRQDGQGDPRPQLDHDHGNIDVEVIKKLRRVTSWGPRWIVTCAA
jgi:hypothetical protein